MQASRRLHLARKPPQEKQLLPRSCCVLSRSIPSFLHANCIAMHPISTFSVCLKYVQLLVSWKVCRAQTARETSAAGFHDFRECPKCPGQDGFLPAKFSEAQKKLRQCEALQERQENGDSLTQPEKEKLSKVAVW
jgi:hypothetical protein